MSRAGPEVWVVGGRFGLSAAKNFKVEIVAHMAVASGMFISE